MLVVAVLQFNGVLEAFPDEELFPVRPIRSSLNGPSSINSRSSIQRVYSWFNSNLEALHRKNFPASTMCNRANDPSAKRAPGA